MGGLLFLEVTVLGAEAVSTLLCEISKENFSIIRYQVRLQSEPHCLRENSDVLA